MIITWSIITIIIAISCAESAATATVNTTILCQVSPIPEFQNTNQAKKCDCPITCANQRAQLGYNWCVTYDNEATISVSFCTYFELSNYNISEPGFISLPDNISELNDYICGSMNRKGVVCSKCIDGYGPSVTSTKFKCSDCSNAWYGVPLYLLLELVPVTLFYIIVLIFQLNLTSAPMISFVLYSNIILLAIHLNTINLDQLQALQKILALSYGIWSLDFFRYAIPPFCVLSNLKIIHALYLQSVSAVFPFVLIGITWICIKLHSRDYKIATWPWQVLHGVIFKHIDAKWNSGRTVIDAFATFFLLSFSKLSLMLLLPLYPLPIRNVNITDLSPTITTQSYTDPSVNFISKEHLPFAAISIALFLFTLLPPVMLLALYPYQRCRSLLFKFLPKRSIGSLNIFVEKFHSCYRDGLDGGRDMRSLASLYFIVLLLGYILHSVGPTVFLATALFGGCSLFIANVQPYKKKYMSVIDSLIFANLALSSAAVDRNIYAIRIFALITGILNLIPALVMFSFIIYKLLKQPLKTVFTSVKQKLLLVKHSLLTFCDGGKDDSGQDEEQRNTENNRDEAQLPD